MNAPDLSDVTMTPTMEALRTVGVPSVQLKAAAEILNDFTTDAGEAAWAEGHQMGHMLKASGRRWSDRAVFGARLGRRGIDTKIDWRVRTGAPIVERKVPEYLTDADLTRIAELAAELTELLAPIAEKREEQYPAYHRGIQAALKKARVTLAEAS
ncbi:hypothetical protein QFZ75_007971 [Streptomyces sp. V3I8]|uniref:hypothetical protein n=1 Tax=Streptomyces sp. V3I8 TaxID=3042279 RepID=UPI00278A3777|nr:hypothetical protein [Streptomyces sp. V3I8]MDQ1041469.1 hypothetical protein [Streptomyces sp. V3I8]